jgi:hypothetical protein
LPDPRQHVLAREVRHGEVCLQAAEVKDGRAVRVMRLESAAIEQLRAMLVALGPLAEQKAD